MPDELFRRFLAGFNQAQKDNGKKTQPSLATLGIDPQKWLKEPKNAGASKVGDEETIKITGQVDVARVLDDVASALQKAQSVRTPTGDKLPANLTDAQKAQIAKAIKTVELEIHTGKRDKILRKVALKLELDEAHLPAAGKKKASSLLKIELSLGLTQVNEDQKIAVPTGALPLSDLLSQFGGLGTLLQSDAKGSEGPVGDKRFKKFRDCVNDAQTDAAKRKCLEGLTGTAQAS